jgi:hypothetical protein
MKIYLEDGTEVEISKESYDALADAAKEWPQKGDEYWCVDGSWVDSITWRGDDYDKAGFSVGNCFKTKEEAELHKLRLQSMAKRWLPKYGERYSKLRKKQKNGVRNTVKHGCIY